MSYTCDNDGQPSVVAISNLNTGDVTAPCADCLLPQMMGFVQALAPEGHVVELVTPELAELINKAREDAAAEAADQAPDGDQADDQPVEQLHTETPVDDAGGRPDGPAAGAEAGTGEPDNAGPDEHAPQEPAPV